MLTPWPYAAKSFRSTHSLVLFVEIGWVPEVKSNNIAIGVLLDAGVSKAFPGE
jgi:hypothetical protein